MDHQPNDIHIPPGGSRKRKNFIGRHVPWRDKPEHRPTANSEIPSYPSDATVQPEQPAPQSLWCTESAPQWSAAVAEWKIAYPKDFEALEKLGIEVSKSPVDDTIERFRNSTSGKTARQSVARIKRWLPVLSAIRGIAMTAAAFDPHKIASVICASVFFSIEVLLAGMTPEDRDKTLDILFECGNTITEYVSFETNFLERTHPAINKDVQRMMDTTRPQYVRALHLVSDLQCFLHSPPSEGLSKTEWLRKKGKIILDKLSNKIQEWEGQAAVLKRHRVMWTTERRALEDKLAADALIAGMRTWIKKDGDPELPFDLIRKIVTSEGRYEEHTSWLFENQDFINWCNILPTVEIQPARKQVLWVNGGYGTGKTTLLYRTYSALKYRTEEFSAPGDLLRVVPYFCNASTGSDSKRPDFETIVRSMCRSLSLLPDLRPAQAALDAYNRSNSAQGSEQDLGQPYSDPWEKLFRDLLSEYPANTQFIFLVDALDECNPTEAVNLLRFMDEVMIEHANVRLLCSSREQLRVSDYMCEEILQQIPVTAEAVEPEMVIYIRGELEHRRKECKRSIFFNPGQTDLLSELEETLFRNANGMFQWVKVWLDILLPTRDPNNTIRLVEDAKRKLEELKNNNIHTHDEYTGLEAGYRRLWELNSLTGFEKRRIRLFQFVLASLEPIPVEVLTDVVRIQDGSYAEEVSCEDVERLYANFLRYTPSQGVQFVHDSARKFILNMKIKDTANDDSEGAQFSEKGNHLSIAELYIEVMSRPSHPIWQQLRIDPSCWRDVFLDSQNFDRLMQDWETWRASKQSLIHYLGYWGLRHCFHAAQKRSIFDGVWTKILNNVVLSLGSAFGFVLLVQYLAEPNPEYDWMKRFNSRCLLRLHDGHLELLYSHVLVCLGLINQDDHVRLQLEGSAMKAGYDQGNLQRLFEHVASSGGFEPDFPWALGARRFPVFVDGRTALHLAVERRDTDAIDVILQVALVSSNARDIARMLDRQEGINSPLVTAILNRDFCVAQKLLEWEIQARKCETNDPNEPPLSSQWSTIGRFIRPQPALSLAIQHFSEDQTRSLLRLARPDDPNVRDDGQNTPLHIAVKYGYLELVIDLVEQHGATFNAENSEGVTPAFYAFIFDQVDVIRYFQGKGAKGTFDADLTPQREQQRKYPDPDGSACLETLDSFIVDGSLPRHR